jgi:ribonuclease E
MALAILRLVGEEARKDRTSKVIVEVPVEVATYLINEKREWLRTLEDKSDVELIVIPNLNIDTPEYSIRRVRDDESETPEFKRLSYQMPTPAKVPEASSTREKQAAQEPAAVPTFLPTTPAPIVVQAPAPVAAAPAAVAAAGPQLGIFVRLWRWLFGAPAPVEPVREARPDRGRGRDRDRDRGGRGRDRDRNEREARGGERNDRGDRGRDRNRDRGPGRPQQDAKPAAAQNERRGERQDDGQRRGREDGRRDESRREDGRRDEGRRRDRQERGPREAERAAAPPAPAQDTALPVASATSPAPQAGGDAVNPSAPEGLAAADGTQGNREGGARRGRRRGRRGRRGGGMRDLPPGATVGDAASGSESGVGDFSDEGDDTVDSSPAANQTAEASRSGEPAAAFDLPQPPQNTGSISWTGLSASEPAAAPPPAAPPAVSHEAEAAAPPASPTQTVAPSQPLASTQTVEPSQPVTPPQAQSAAETAASSEKKVVWSSSPPDRYSSFGSGTRRDDY